MWGGSIRLHDGDALRRRRSSSQFVIGGLSGITLRGRADRLADDRHLLRRRPLPLRALRWHGVRACFGGVYYWFPKMTGRLLDERVGQASTSGSWSSASTSRSSCSTSSASSGCRAACTRTPTCRTGARSTWCRPSARSSWALSVARLRRSTSRVSLRRGKLAGDNPWDAWTLEWATTSPPPHDNFERVPPGARPAAALGPRAHPEARLTRQREARADPPAKPERRASTRAPSPSGRSSPPRPRSSCILIIAYVFFNGDVRGAGPIAASALDVKRTGVFTALPPREQRHALAAPRRRLDRRGGARHGVLARASRSPSGVVFLVGQGSEYADCSSAASTVEHEPLRDDVLHAHGLSRPARHGGPRRARDRARRSRSRATYRTTRPSRALRAVGLYWHFVDVVWIVVFSVVYLRRLV